MKQIFLVATLIAGTLSLSAQHTMQVWQGTDYSEYSTAVVDSITFLDEPEGTLITCEPEIDTVFVTKTDTITQTVTKRDTVYLKPATTKSIGRYAVATGKYVTFTRGNLQYHAATNRWRLAEHQYDIIGESNANISDTYNGWIDLFGWGTRMYPTLTEKDNSRYPTFVDWGTNLIGTDEPDTWRTLTYDEWIYLFQYNQWTLARVNGLLGVMLIPKTVSLPEGTTMNLLSTKYPPGEDKIYSHSFTREDYENNNYTLEQFALLEKQGVVFLPMAGWRNEKSVVFVGEECTYWSATADAGAREAGMVYIREIFVRFVKDDRYPGCSVRLVKDVK